MSPSTPSPQSFPRVCIEWTLRHDSCSVRKSLCTHMEKVTSTKPKYPCANARSHRPAHARAQTLPGKHTLLPQNIMHNRALNVLG